MNTAIRGRMLDGDHSEIGNLTRKLQSRAWEAAKGASSYAAARAKRRA